MDEHTWHMTEVATWPTGTEIEADVFSVPPPVAACPVDVFHDCPLLPGAIHVSIELTDDERAKLNEFLHD